MDKFLVTYNLQDWRDINLQTKALYQFILWWTLSNIQRKFNTYPAQTTSNNWRGEYTFKLILWGQHYPDTKTKQGYHKKRKLQASMPHEHWCKNPQQNISKLNSTIHEKIIYIDQVGFIPEIQGPQINQHDTHSNKMKNKSLWSS